MEENQNNKSNYLLPISIILAAILISGALVYNAGKKEINNNSATQPINNANVGNNTEINLQISKNDVVLGDSKAPVTMFVIGDYQCPFCAKFYKETETKIRKNYIETNKIKLVFKGVSFLGKESLDALAAVDCAKNQNQYWLFHDAIYDVEYTELQDFIAGKTKEIENNGNLNTDLFKKIATTLKMDVNKFLECYNSQTHTSAIAKIAEENTQEADKAIVSRGEKGVSTPTIFINGVMKQGALPYEVFQSAIEDALNLLKK